MKKIVLIATLLFGLTTITNAQVSVTEDNNIKNFRFGLKGDFSMNWLSPNEKNELENGGIGIGYAWGLQLEFRLNKTISVVTGVNLLSASYKLNYKDASAAGESYYVLNANEDFVDISGNTMGQYDTSSQSRFLLENRHFRGNYVNIPVGLKMKTNEIGYFTYFGEFGANINILTKARVIEDDAQLDGTAVTKGDLDMTKSTGLFNAGIRVGGGAEYNISGNTSIFFGVHYNHYFVNALRKNDKYLQKEDLLSTSGEYKSAGQIAIPGAVSLTVGILF